MLTTGNGSGAGLHSTAGNFVDESPHGRAPAALSTSAPRPSSDRDGGDYASDSESGGDPADGGAGSGSGSLAADSAESRELAAYLSSPSAYVSASPGLELSAAEISARAEVEELLGRLKGQQRALVQSRAASGKQIEQMRAAVRRVRRDTDELIKSQQTNIATMGRKIR